MTKIILHGELAEKCGAEWELEVRSVAEAIRAIEANHPGIVEYLADSGDRGIDFHVQVDRETIASEDDLRTERAISVIEISPVVRGSKDPIFQIVLGVILIAVAVFVPGMQGLAFGIKGLTWGSLIGGMGFGLAIGGVVQLIAGTPDSPKADPVKSSALFQGAENTTSQGGPVPLLYGGPIIVGSQVISAGIYTEDTTIATSVTDGGNTHYWDGPFRLPVSN